MLANSKAGQSIGGHTFGAIHTSGGQAIFGSDFKDSTITFNNGPGPGAGQAAASRTSRSVLRDNMGNFVGDNSGTINNYYGRM